jgi:hypothetical protein
VQSGVYLERTSHFPVIEYRYTVDGKRYVTDSYCEYPWLLERKWIIRRILANYPAGATVTVYYNPDDPQEAYLQRGYGGTVRLVILLVAVVVILSVIL